MNFLQWVKTIIKKDPEYKGFRYAKSFPFKPAKRDDMRSRIGITKKDKKLSKVRRKMAKESRRINRQRMK
jgi:hypothetical protein